MDGIKLTQLKKIINSKGNLLHALKKSDDGFGGFGEAYFSTVHDNVIKGWKKHTVMTLNIIVPSGSIEFVCFNGTKFKSIELSQENYQRLTISPGLWMAFRGKSKGLNLLLNIASIEHDPKESISCDLDDIYYEW